MISAPDRRRAVELIDEARKSGARLEPACRELGITARTYQRWTKDGQVRTDRRPEVPRPAPANKLSPEERESVLSICHDPRYASLPPGQIVPKLADQGVYIASESSFYRILREADEQHHRGRSRKPQLSTTPKGYCATGPNQVWSWDISVPQQAAGEMRDCGPLDVGDAGIPVSALITSASLHTARSASP
jgi:hypothetical protein